MFGVDLGFTTADLALWLPIFVGLLHLWQLAIWIPRVILDHDDFATIVSWIAVLVLLPIVGLVLFMLFGRPAVDNGLQRKIKHRQALKRQSLQHEQPENKTQPPSRRSAEPFPGNLASLAENLGAETASRGNRVSIYGDGLSAHDAMMEMVRSASKSVYLQLPELPIDDATNHLIQALAERCKAGVQVRILVDGEQGKNLPRRYANPIIAAGGKCRSFLPMRLWNSKKVGKVRRNHRSLLVVDGKSGFCAGVPLRKQLLSGEEAEAPCRENFVRIDGPAAQSMQNTFAMDWHFVTGEKLQDNSAIAPVGSAGKGASHAVQILESGPDLDNDGMTEMLFAAISSAQERVWLVAGSFQLPDVVRRTLKVAAHRGIDVRILSPLRPARWLQSWASRQEWPELLQAGIKLYQYTGGEMHSNMALVDGQWALVTTTEMDQPEEESHFDISCLFYSSSTVAELEAAYQEDLCTSIRLEEQVITNRPRMGRIVEKTCQLLLS